ncbi:MAG: TetR/AcrR family transcriptional regulator [Bacteroidales bacterium]|nr:TetR/AcrR family transcriptional regulator [Bacteroidales bacterium]
MRKTTTPTRYRQDLKDKIVRVAMNEFKSRGVRDVKMDDIANALSISKRTLYEVFDNKEELLICGIKLDEERRKEMMTSFVVKNNPGVMDVILKFYHAQMEAISSINPVFFSDISKYDRVRAYLQELHAGRQESALEFFRRGVGEGYFRADVDYVIVSRMSNATINYVMESQMYKEYDLKYIFRNIVLVFLRGLCTLKGQEIIDKKLNEKT